MKEPWRGKLITETIERESDIGYTPLVNSGRALDDNTASTFSGVPTHYHDYSVIHYRFSIL